MNHPWCQLQLQNQTQTPPSLRKTNQKPEGQQGNQNLLFDEEQPPLSCSPNQPDTVLLSLKTYLWLCYAGKRNLAISCLSVLFGIFPIQRCTSWMNFRLRSRAGRVFWWSRIRLVLAQLRGFPSLFPRHERHHWISSIVTSPNRVFYLEFPPASSFVFQP